MPIHGNSGSIDLLFPPLTSACWKKRYRVREGLLSSPSSLPRRESLNLRHGKIATPSNFLYPQNRKRSEEVARHSACTAHVILFCPTPQPVSGYFLFPDPCQWARHEHRMQILTRPGSAWNSLGLHPNSSPPCLLNQAEGRAHKRMCTNTSWTSHGRVLVLQSVNPLKSDDRAEKINKQRLSEAVHLPEWFHSWFKHI